MGFRFQKRIRIFKGLTLNLSKSGSSWTVGRPGASVNFRGDKVSGNVGIPGSGISHHTAANLFPIPHRPIKLLIEPAACKSLKIIKVASRALASLLITESGNGGNRVGKRAAQDATLATSLRFSLGNRQKKSQLIRVGTLSIGGSLKYETTSASTQKSSTTF